MVNGVFCDFHSTVARTLTRGISLTGVDGGGLTQVQHVIASR